MPSLILQDRIVIFRVTKRENEWAGNQNRDLVPHLMLINTLPFIFTFTGILCKGIQLNRAQMHRKIKHDSQLWKVKNKTGVPWCWACRFSTKPQNPFTQYWADIFWSLHLCSWKAGYWANVWFTRYGRLCVLSSPFLTLEEVTKPLTFSVHHIKCKVCLMRSHLHSSLQRVDRVMRLGSSFVDERIKSFFFFFFSAE